MANFASQLIPRCHQLTQAYESIGNNLQHVQQEIVKFRLLHLTSLLDRFNVRVALKHEIPPSNVLQIVNDIHAILELNTTSSTAFRLWKDSNSLLFEFAVKGVIDLIDLKGVSNEVSQKIESLYRMLWKLNKEWDLRMDDSIVGFWTTRTPPSSGQAYRLHLVKRNRMNVGNVTNF